MDATVEKFGTIHVALASAGVYLYTPTLTKNKTLDPRTYETLFKINVFGSIYVAKYASIIMSKNKPVNEEGEKGVIMFVSSLAGTEGTKGSEGYAATKGAINGLTLPMARSLGKYNIRVVTVVPGLFLTPITSFATKEMMETSNKSTPMGRAGLPKEFAHFVQSIIENSYLNGANLRIDGAQRPFNL